MGWSEAEEEVQSKIDGRFVSSDDKYEIRYVKDAIKEHVNDGYSDEEVDEAIAEYCNESDPPHPRAVFMESIKVKLEE